MKTFEIILNDNRGSNTIEAYLVNSLPKYYIKPDLNTFDS